nr:MAG TPA: Protein of unknown function (DUF1366) [Caudoviricetes sp.]
MSLTEFNVESKLFVIDKTDVAIKKEYPYTFIRRSLPGNWTDKSDEAIINAVVEVVNTEFDPTSAIAKFTLLQNEMKQTIEHTKKNSEIGQKALLELAGQVTEVVTDIEILKTAVFGEGHENEEEHSTDTAPSTTPVTPTTTPVAPTAPTAPPVAPVTPTTPEVTPQPTAPTAPVATEPTSTVPETTAQPVVPTPEVTPQPVVTAPTTNINTEVEHHESTETNIPQGQPTGISSENTTSSIAGIQ